MADITVISITNDNVQIVAHGYGTFDNALKHIKSRVAYSRAPGSLVSYRKFIVVATVQDIDGVHVFNGNGIRTRREAFL